MEKLSRLRWLRLLSACGLSLLFCSGCLRRQGTRGLIEFNGILSGGGGRYFLLTGGEGEARRSRWVKLNETFGDGLAVVEYEPARHEIVLARGPSALLLPLKRGEVFHPNEFEPLTRQEALSALRDFIQEYGQKIQTQPGYIPYKPMNLARVKAEEKAEFLAETKAAAESNEILLWHEGEKGKNARIRIPSLKKFSPLPREFIKNLSAADLEQFSEDYARFVFAGILTNGGKQK
jgi:hypothetical protein